VRPHRAWSTYDGAVDVQSRIAANRRRLADFFDSLDDHQLGSRSLCEAWTVREVLGHLVMPLTGSLGGFLLQVVKERGSIDRASAAMARDLSRRPLADLTSLLRAKADEMIPAPGVGPLGQFADGCVHLRDCARPLGLPDDASLEDWRTLLDWFSGGVRGLVPKKRLEGLQLVATDQDWSTGVGHQVTGPSEALAMAVSGRPAALSDLSGSGVGVLRMRLHP
jgi:uncharacterized protein (TIGR03083 family)